MKANELMIGDWVLSKSDDKIYKINSIITQDDGTILLATEDGLRFDYMCEPIPLTAEILEKNGFTCDSNGINDSDELVVCVEYGEYQRNTDDGFKMLADGKAIKYVHELQHALRLCGVEKEIIL